MIHVSNRWTIYNGEKGVHDWTFEGPASESFPVSIGPIQTKHPSSISTKGAGTSTKVTGPETTVAFPTLVILVSVYASTNEANKKNEFEEKTKPTPRFLPRRWWDSTRFSTFATLRVGLGEVYGRRWYRDDAFYIVTLVRESWMGLQGTYSCASETSPVIAVKPIKGLVGSVTFSRRKQSDHSSPETLELSNWI